METVWCENWRDFLEKIEEIRSKFYDAPLILFRGQNDAKWELQTTLERETPEKNSVLDYMEYALKELESQTNREWCVSSLQIVKEEIKREQKMVTYLPHYDYLVYLRHHGFPSPLLDWTESQFIAAYFAFNESKAREVALYCYIERPNRKKGGNNFLPMVTIQTHHIKAHPRHHAQKAWYTVCTKGSEIRNFCSHVSAFGRNDDNQDILYKIILPVEIKKEVLKILCNLKINHYTLFQSEDSLVQAID